MDPQTGWHDKCQEERKLLMHPATRTSRKVRLDKRPAVGLAGNKNLTVRLAMDLARIEENPDCANDSSSNRGSSSEIQ